MAEASERGNPPAVTADEEQDAEREARLAQVQSVVDLVADIWDVDAVRIPGWVTQDLTLGQLRLLFLLKDRGPLPIGRIAETLKVGLPAASGIVDRVERHGLVLRQHRMDDRRVVECGLTERGEQVVGEILGVRRSIVREAVSVLSNGELAELHALLRAVVDRSGLTP